MRFIRLICCLIAFSAVLTLTVVSGCSAPSSSEVSGTITLHGRPPNLNEIQIIFIAPNGRMAAARLGEDGAYKADAVPVGEVGISFAYVPIDMIQKIALSGRKPDAGSAGSPESSTNASSPAANPIPKPLRDATTSQVTFKVEPGKKNVFDYDIRP